MAVCAGTIYSPKQCGIKLEPPSLILVYEDTISNKLRQRIMPIRQFQADSKVNIFAQELKIRHRKHLENVPQVLIEKMLRILQEHLCGLDLETAVTKVRAEFEVEPDENLNLLGDEALSRKKAMMDVSFTKTQIRPGDPDFVYDRRIDFPQAHDPSEWDLDDNGGPVDTPLDSLDSEHMAELLDDQATFLPSMHESKEQDDKEFVILASLKHQIDNDDKDDKVPDTKCQQSLEHEELEEEIPELLLGHSETEMSEEETNLDDDDGEFWN